MSDTKENGKKSAGLEKLSSSGDFLHFQDLDKSFFRYLEDLKRFEVCSDSDKDELIWRVDNAMNKLQEIIFSFAPAVIAFMHTLEDLYIGEKLSYTDIFPSSSLQKASAELHNSFAEKWHEHIEKLLNELKKDFRSAHSENIRAELITECSLFRINYDYLDIFFNRITDYLTLWSEDDSLHIRNSSKLIKSYSPEQRSFLSEKFLLPGELLDIHLKSLFDIHSKLTTLKHEILKNHLRLVISIASKFRNRGVPFNDIIQEGNLGLMRAIDKFDPHLGHKFSTYAVWWIKQNIIQGIADQSRTIRIPSHMLTLINKINHTEQKLLQIYGREPDSEEIAAELELSTAKVNAIRCMARQAISLQSPIGNESENFSLEDTLQDNTESRNFTDFDKDVTYRMLYKLLRTLSKREQEIITLRFGLFGNKPTPFTELSKRYNLTRERVRQLELKILNKLRAPDKLKLLDYHLNNDQK